MVASISHETSKMYSEQRDAGGRYIEDFLCLRNRFSLRERINVYHEDQ